MLLRAGVFVLLIIWTAVYSPSVWPVTVVAMLLFILTHMGRRRGWWPLPGGLGLGLDIGLALVLPLITGGWRSPWVFDTLLVLTWCLLRAPKRALLLLSLWYVSVPVLTLVGGLSAADVAWWATMLLGVPLLLALLVANQRHQQPAQLERSVLQQLQLVQQTVHQIERATVDPQIQRWATDSSSTLRDLLARLEPERPLPITVVGRIQTLMRQWQERTAIQVDFTLVLPTRTLPPIVQGILLRALEETLSNIERHAKATFVEVDLRGDDEQLVLTVRDDGVGLSAGALERPGCHGLRTLRYRVQEINGYLDIFEGVDGGLVVQVAMPLTVYAL